jgi:hypothetical protein
MKIGMHPIPADLKQLYFDKGADEELTADEQALWENLVEFSKAGKDINNNLDDATLIKAVELFLKLREEDLASWEEFQKKVLQKN